LDVNVKTIATLAIGDIEKAMQDPDHHWIRAIQRDTEQKAPLDRIHLHGTLRTAAETFSRSHPELAANLQRHLRHLDGLPQVNEHD